jgi:hypothetical protein
MVAVLEWLSPARAAGLAVSTICFAACVAQWENRRSKKLPARASAAVAVLQFGLLLDMAYAWRWKLHEFLLREAVALGLYEQRRVPQILALSLIALAGAVASAVILHRCRCMTGVALAFTGTLLSVGLWCCEWVSFHFLDSILYRTVGGVMLVSLLRIGFALIVCCGVWIDARSLRPVKLKS